MIKIKKRQVAHKEHECDECGLEIHVGQEYDRVAQFESWSDVGHPEPVFSEQSDPYVQQQIWKSIMRSKNVLILKMHAYERECGLAASQRRAG